MISVHRHDCALAAAKDVHPLSHGYVEPCFSRSKNFLSADHEEGNSLDVNFSPESKSHLDAFAVEPATVQPHGCVLSQSQARVAFTAIDECL